jgi:glycosyltransferase involved in cell wall biosynthesis
MASSTGVSVVVPVYNNAATLPELCRRLQDVLRDRPTEIILVDDASTDESRRVIEALRVSWVWHPRNAGQNAAILSGLRVATHPLASVLDADLEDPPEGIPLMLLPLENGTARVAFSSRDEVRTLGSRMFRWTIQRLFPSLPAHPSLCFAIDPVGRQALLGVSRGDDYLPAVIGALGLRSVEVAVARRARPASAGPSAYAALRRVRYAVMMLRASLRVWWRPPARHSGEASNCGDPVDHLTRGRCPTVRGTRETP